MKQLIDRLWNLAKANPNGFTVRIPECTPVTSGYAIGMASTQNCHGRKGLKKAVEISLETTKVLGGWKGYNDRYYFDAIIITEDGREALDLKYDEKQIAIYHINTGRIL